MRKTGLSIALFFFTIGAMAQSGIQIEGTIDPKLNGRVINIRTGYLQNSTINLPKLNDSCLIVNGTFFFNLPTNDIQSYEIRVESKYIQEEKKKGVSLSMPVIYLYLPPKAIKLNIIDTLLKKYEIIGDDGLNTKVRSLFAQTSSSKYAPHEIVNNKLKWIEENKNTPISLLGIGSLSQNIPDEQLQKLFQDTPDSLKTNIWAKETDYYLENLIKGKPAPLFSLPDTTGKTINLSDYRGKYTLIEFWASWCIPCRKEAPHLAEAYNKYRKKGFEILNISIDTDNEKWKAAILEDKLFWPQVIDKGTELQYVMRTQYKIFAVPTNFLIDPEGRIIRKDLRGKQLMETLTALESLNVQ